LWDGIVLNVTRVSLHSDIVRVPILLQLIYCTDDAGATSCPVVIVYPKTFRNFRVNVYILYCKTRNFVLNLTRYVTNGFLFPSDDFVSSTIFDRPIYIMYDVCDMYILFRHDVTPHAYVHYEQTSRKS